MADTFTADISAFIDKIGDLLDLVVASSAQEVVKVAQAPKAKGGRMPVDTGFLRNSLQASLQGGTSLTGPEGYVAVVSGMRAGQIADFGWTATYAAAVEFGAQGRKPAFFARGAIQQWEAIVMRQAQRFAEL